MSAGVHQSRKRALDFLELQLLVIMSWSMWVPGDPEIGSLYQSNSTHDHWAPFQSPKNKLVVSLEKRRVFWGSNSELCKYSTTDLLPQSSFSPTLLLSCGVFPTYLYISAFVFSKTLWTVFINTSVLPAYTFLYSNANWAPQNCLQERVCEKLLGTCPPPPVNSDW